MNFGFIYLGISAISLVISILILQEIRLANQKEACKFNERLLKNLIDKIDKVIVSDKVESA